MKLSHAGLTDVGMKRTHNEDNLILLPDHHVFVVADGMGGHASGEVASQIACDTVAQFFVDMESDEDITWPYKEDRTRAFVENAFVNSVRYANLRVWEKSREDARYRGMGTTLVGVVFDEGRAFVAHVGDSRCYRVRERQLDQMTEDHSLLNDYKKMAKLTPEEEKNFPHKNIIVRALGMKETVLVDVNADDIRPGDLYLLCSDGLSGEVEDDSILELVLENWDDLDQMCRALIQQACANGGKDNVTAAVIRVEQP